MSRQLDLIAGTDLFRKVRRGSVASDSPASVIRRAYLQDTFYSLPLVEQWRREAVYGKQLRLEVDRAVVRYAERLGPDAEVTLSELSGDVERVCREHLLRPKDYFRYRLYESARRPLAADLLGRRLTKYWLFGFIHDGLDVTKRAPVTDKVRFAEHCAEHGLSCVPVLATFRGGSVSTQAPLPEQDLFFKPIGRKGGFGAEAWSWEGEGAYRRVGDDKMVNADKLVRRFRKRSLGEDYFVSPRIVNHPGLTPFSMGALSTVRILVAVDEQGEPEVVAAVFRMATKPKKVVDNAHAGGIAARVDVATGELGAAISLDPTRTGELVEHPGTGAPIAGARLPSWGDVSELARAAQHAFAPRLVTAWDIAITPDGPMLVEGNSRPGLDLIQQSEGPLGRTRLGELLAHHVAAKARDASDDGPGDASK